ncbi:hypothetical protein GGI19_005884, partial [Coemansia pectinata]
KVRFYPALNYVPEPIDDGPPPKSSIQFYPPDPDATSDEPRYMIVHRIRTSDQTHAALWWEHTSIKSHDGHVLLTPSQIRSIDVESSDRGKYYLARHFLNRRLGANTYIEPYDDRVPFSLSGILRTQSDDISSTRCAALLAISAARVEARIAAALKIEWRRSNVKELRSLETSLKVPIIEMPTAIDVVNFIRKVRTPKVEINPRGADRSIIVICNKSEQITPSTGEEPPTALDASAEQPATPHADPIDCEHIVSRVGSSAGSEQPMAPLAVADHGEAHGVLPTRQEVTIFPTPALPRTRAPPVAINRAHQQQQHITQSFRTAIIARQHASSAQRFSAAPGYISRAGLRPLLKGVPASSYAPTTVPADINGAANIVHVPVPTGDTNNGIKVITLNPVNQGAAGGGFAYGPTQQQVPDAFGVGGGSLAHFNVAGHGEAQDVHPVDRGADIEQNAPAQQQAQDALRTVGAFHALFNGAGNDEGLGVRTVEYGASTAQDGPTQPGLHVTFGTDVAFPAPLDVTDNGEADSEADSESDSEADGEGHGVLPVEHGAILANNPAKQEEGMDKIELMLRQLTTREVPPVIGDPTGLSRKNGGGNHMPDDGLADYESEDEQAGDVNNNVWHQVQQLAARNWVMERRHRLGITEITRQTWIVEDMYQALVQFAFDHAQGNIEGARTALEVLAGLSDHNMIEAHTLAYQRGFVDFIAFPNESAGANGYPQGAPSSGNASDTEDNNQTGDDNGGDDVEGESQQLSTFIRENPQYLWLAGRRALHNPDQSHDTPDTARIDGMYYALIDIVARNARKNHEDIEEAVTEIYNIMDDEIVDRYREVEELGEVDIEE